MEISKKASIKRQNGSSMEKKYFPIFIDISEKKIVVIGGGNIATRRVNTLLMFAKQIEVVAPEVTAELRELADKGEIIWTQCGYCKEQVYAADIVLATTNYPEINHRVKADCEQIKEETGRNVLVNIADDKTMCDFYFPGIVNMGEIVVGINSGGNNPGLVKNTRKKIQSLLDSE